MGNYKKGVGNYKQAGSGVYTLIESKELTAETTDITFTFTAINFDNVSELVLIVDGSITQSLAPEITVNGLGGALYEHDNRSLIGGVEALNDYTNATVIYPCNTNILTTANMSFYLRMTFTISKGATADQILYTYEVTALPGHSKGGGVYNAETASISSIEIGANTTNSYQIGTRLSLYKISR